VTLMDDRYIGSGQTRGYCYVQMPSRSEGQAAVLSLKEKRLRGIPIRVVEALPLSDSVRSDPTRARGPRKFGARRR
jgi:RNA recognition motif-containing protein